MLMYSRTAVLSTQCRHESKPAQMNLLRLIDGLQGLSKGAAAAGIDLAPFGSINGFGELYSGGSVARLSNSSARCEADLPNDGLASMNSCIILQHESSLIFRFAVFQQLLFSGKRAG